MMNRGTSRVLEMSVDRSSLAHNEKKTIDHCADSKKNN